MLLRQFIRVAATEAVSVTSVLIRRRSQCYKQSICAVAFLRCRTVAALADEPMTAQQILKLAPGTFQAVVKGKYQLTVDPDARRQCSRQVTGLDRQGPLDGAQRSAVHRLADLDEGARRVFRGGCRQWLVPWPERVVPQALKQAFSFGKSIAFQLYRRACHSRVAGAAESSFSEPRSGRFPPKFFAGSPWPITTTRRAQSRPPILLKSRPSPSKRRCARAISITP